MFAVADSVSPMSFLNEKTANRLQTNDISARFKYIPLKDAARKLACYNEKCINPKGLLKTAIESVRLDYTIRFIHNCGRSKS